MGAWGTGPLDSDSALDWLANAITDHAEKEVLKALQMYEEQPEFYEEELRAAGEVVLALNFWQENLHGRIALALRTLRANEDYVSRWNHEDEIRESLDRQIALLEMGPRSTSLTDFLESHEGGYPGLKEPGEES